VKLIELSIPGYSSWNHRCGATTEERFANGSRTRTSKRSGRLSSATSEPLDFEKERRSRTALFDGPGGQAKVVTCAHGELDDVIVDIRVGSPAFGRCEIVHLAAGEERSVYVPVGVAHGFCVTSDLGALTYLLSSPFNAAFEFEINPFDAEISVPWTIVGEAVVSPKDAGAPSLRERRDAKELPLFR